MPIVVVEKNASLAPAVKAELAAEITDVLHTVIKSPDDLISVVFHDLPAESTFRAGVPTDEALIFVHIRLGRSDEAVDRLLKAISDVWVRVTGESDDAIELAAMQYPAKWTMRGGVRLPEPPIV
jgi:phenylpyruvate tautomerase PptA (4-oxalocrotonate tautomerase family)